MDGIEILGYDENVDYRTKHIEWLRSKKGFRPKGGNPLPMQFPTYLEYLNFTYFSNDGLSSKGDKRNRYAFMNLRDDVKWAHHSKDIVAEVDELFGFKPKNTNPTFFVTFNWNDSNFKLEHALKGVERLFSKSWVDNARGVFEYHTENGNHPHFMALIQVNCHKTLGKFRDKMFECSLANGLAKNFIDVKVAKSYHEDYIDLDKQESKREFLELDVEWRNNLGIKHEYSK